MRAEEFIFHSSHIKENFKILIYIRMWKELAKKVLQNRGKDELKRAIFRALDIEETPANPQQTPGEEPSQGEETPQEETRPEKILIDGIFDAIFKGQETP